MDLGINTKIFAELIKLIFDRFSPEKDLIIVADLLLSTTTPDALRSVGIMDLKSKN
ncbi:MAG: hypothetical protein ACFFAN_17510 [Promethearchaeota archaeon]